MRHLEKTQRTQYIVRYGEESAIDDAVFRFEETKSANRKTFTRQEFEEAWINRIPSRRSEALHERQALKSKPSKIFEYDLPK